MRRLIDPSLRKALLDGPEVEPEIVAERDAPPDLSIDSMLQRGLAAIDRLMRVITLDISGGHPSRETVMSLKDCVFMLNTLKEKENELLESMSEEELEKAASE